ncbi:hypothetical protein CYY_001030 [Polysphondylium violaceum]|uniref:Major facilitator superfamily (MFS) profile domain-containing protein n=1 Tax=Polysphondylium violaceum TaxID=133409 RepID=A0A8J4PYS2_9MYCE|nr:hypothetical protein CYY_001030 [Polysphondylium violaceum]
MDETSNNNNNHNSGYSYREKSVQIIENNSNINNNNNEQEEIEKPKRIHIISLISVMAIGFIANVEYGIVMPSIWNYLQSVGGTNHDLGMALAGFSLAQVCFLPLIGLWADKRTMRESFCASLVIGIIGNIMYAMSVHPLMIIAGRFIAGVGSSNMALTNSYIASVSTKEQRTKYMAKVNGINAFGLVAGPAFNLAINLLNKSFWIGSVHFIFDPLRSPGWLLAILLLCCLLSFVLFKEPKEYNKQLEEEEQKEKQVTPGNEDRQPLLNNNNNNSTNNSTSGYKKSVSKYGSISAYDVEGQLIKRSPSQRDIINSNYLSATIISPHSSFSHFSSKKFSEHGTGHASLLINSGGAVVYSEEKESFWSNLKKILNSSLITCFVINFVQNFVFGALETLITPITQEQYNFGTLQNSLMYSIVSVEIIIFIFATVIASGKGIQDKFIVFFGQLFLGGGLIILLIFFGGQASEKVALWKFALGVAITTVGIPTQNTSVYSLYSKLLNRVFGDNADQGFQTGFMMLMGSAARILGPLWAGYGLELSSRFPLFIVFISLWVFDIFITLLFFKKLTFITDPTKPSTTSFAGGH